MNLKNLTYLVFVVLLLSNCKKKDANIYFDSEGTLGYDGLIYTDSLTLLTKTVREDSLFTDSLSHNLIGLVNDPDFGIYKSNTFFELNLPQFGKVINNRVLDSVVLFLNYTSNIAYYGDLTQNVNLSIYELNQSMLQNINYSNQSYTYNSTPIGSFNGKFKLSDSIKLKQGSGNVKIPATFKLKLSSQFANKLFNASATDLTSQDNFKQYIKGLAIVANGNNGNIVAVNLESNFSRLRLYYDDSLYSDFNVGGGSKRFSQYEILNQSNAIVQQKLAPTKQDFNATYIQAMSGAKTQILMPFLFSMIKNPSKRISIAKVELIIRPQSASFNSIFSLPKRLLCLQPNKTTNLNTAILDLFAGNNLYGGGYDKEKNYYKFNITRHIQSLFTDFQTKGENNNRGLFVIIPTENPIAPSRMIIDTQKKLVNQGIEIKIYYAEL